VPALALLLYDGPVCAQQPRPPLSEVERAQAELDRRKALVEAGAAPLAELERAGEALQDARDLDFLRRTLYGPELAEEQIEEMLNRSARRLERRRSELEKQKKLVREGVASQASLGGFLEELDRARKENDLAASRARLTRELAQMARAEQALETALRTAPDQAEALAERFEGGGVFTSAELARVRRAFAERFARSLPLSAVGETPLHRSLGFDHRDRVDVALHPDQPEGTWLLQYLESRGIPYFAFRRAAPGRSTAAHIHIGPMSGRLTGG